jgi:hypothetical protein
MADAKNKKQLEIGLGQTDESKSNKESQMVKAAEKISYSPLSFLVGGAMLIVSLIGMVIAYKWDGHTYDRRGCINIIEIKEHVIALDNCGGSWHEIKLPANKTP